ncbi:MAG: hypothetical protein J4F41_02210 [Alphaproteobacteria bacterium]|nr:hypothetical protein [Alphaproteobacteria bacterium]
MRNLASTSLIRFLVLTTLGLSLMTSLSACGKRGDPYRPAEVSSTSTS